MNSVTISTVQEYLDKVKAWTQKKKWTFLEEDAFGDGDKLQGEYFFRGENDFYSFVASLYRNGRGHTEEKRLLEEFTSYFHEECRGKTCFEKLLMAQHYSLPTRFIDVTLNPLVALYFACRSKEDKWGRVYIFAVPKRQILSADSDRLNIISHIAFLPKKDQDTLEVIVKSAFAGNDITTARVKFEKLTAELKKDKFAYHGYIVLEHLIERYFVKPIYSNPRIRAQLGGFLLAGTKFTGGRPAPKQELCFVSNKKAILEELDLLGINELSLFPEKEHAANYLKWKYNYKK